MLTRLGESGVDAFTIMRIAGHSTIVVSQRYVHPSSEAIENVVERLEALNDRVALKAKESEKRHLPATVSIRSCNDGCCAVNYAESTVPGWRNGIRGGLKILWPSPAVPVQVRLRAPTQAWTASMAYGNYLAAVDWSETVRSGSGTTITLQSIAVVSDLYAYVTKDQALRACLAHIRDEDAIKSKRGVVSVLEPPADEQRASL